MKKARIVIENKKEEIKDIEDSYSIKNLLLIILIIVIVFVAFYFITTLVVKPSKQNYSNKIVEIDSEKIILNQLLNRKETEYYVLAIKESNYTDQMNYVEIYDKYIKSYISQENSLTFYRADLDDALNKNYISDSYNISDNLEQLKLNDDTLFLIKDSKIESYYIGSSEIVKTLSELK